MRSFHPLLFHALEDEMLATLMFMILILGLIFVPYAIRVLARESGDAVIDGLIESNRARQRPGMETVDWQKVSVIGGARWKSTVQAQGRSRGR